MCHPEFCDHILESTSWGFLIQCWWEAPSQAPSAQTSRLFSGIIYENFPKEVMSWWVFAASGSQDKEISLEGGFAGGYRKVILWLSLFLGSWSWTYPMQVRACWGRTQKGKIEEWIKKKIIYMLCMNFLWGMGLSLTPVQVSYPRVCHLDHFSYQLLGLWKKIFIFWTLRLQTTVVNSVFFQWDIKTFSLTAIYHEVQKRGWNLLPMNVEWKYHVHIKHSQAHFETLKYTIFSIKYS